MCGSLVATWRRVLAVVMLCGQGLLRACGGGSTNLTNAPSGLEAGDATDIKAVIAAVPAGSAADKRPAAAAQYIPASGTFTIPPRTALAYVVN